MKTKWTDCSSLQELAAAQTRGDEIDVYAGGEWSIWDETAWHEREEYRCRPAQAVKENSELHQQLAEKDAEIVKLQRKLGQRVSSYNTFEQLRATEFRLGKASRDDEVAKLRQQLDKALSACKTKDELIEKFRRAIGDHCVPYDCYATGPLTGNEYLDLVQCPACSALAAYEEALAATESKP